MGSERFDHPILRHHTDLGCFLRLASQPAREQSPHRCTLEELGCLCQSNLSGYSTLNRFQCIRHRLLIGRIDVGNRYVEKNTFRYTLAPCRAFHPFGHVMPNIRMQQIEKQQARIVSWITRAQRDNLCSRIPKRLWHVTGKSLFPVLKRWCDLRDQEISALEVSAALDRAA